MSDDFLTDDDYRALRLLAEAPRGITTLLLYYNGVDYERQKSLRRRGLVDLKVVNLAHPRGTKQNWLRITLEGRAALAALPPRNPPPPPTR